MHDHDSAAPKRDVQLEIAGLVKDFDGFMAVNNVSLKIHRGEIFALLGASGCGKSTLLRMLAGFEAPSAGNILLDGKRLNGTSPHQRPINMMFQSYALFPHMTVEQNIAFGLKQDKLSRTEIARKVENALNLVRMSDYARRKPYQLSGGQQQRVALARSLAKEPKLLLLDEPMGALDKKLRSQMQLEIVAILEKVGVTCVMVTHDQEEAMTMADRVGIMDAGVLRQIGRPWDVYEQPNCRMVAEFIGNANILEGRLTVDEIDHAEIETAALPQPIRIAHGVSGTRGMELAYALRPEKVMISRNKPGDIANVARGTVEDIAYLGSHSIFHVRLESGFLLQAAMTNAVRLVAGEEESRITWNDPVYVSWGNRSGVVLTS